MTGDTIDLDAETLKWYRDKQEEREKHAEEAKADLGEVSFFKVGENLRTTWMVAQRADKTLIPMFSHKATLAGGYRFADDGLLERQVDGQPKALWVPTVPEGQATSTLSWKRWVFLQCHVGMLGAHRSSKKTLMIILRQCWWQGAAKDIEDWCQRCITCLRFRRVATKQQSPVATAPLEAECWEEVMIDLDGPYSPADKQGNQYTMTYICCLCHGILTGRSPKCNAAEARRMLANCMLRSGTMPTLLRSDRGQAFKNVLMAEYTALVGLHRRFGTPWRPMEQGLVEGAHKETQKIMGIMVKDVMQCFPNETGELQHVVEFVVYNTPGPHGFTPRDIDRRRSLATPLERELQPFHVKQFEPLTEYSSKLFTAYREMRVRVLGYLCDTAGKRAELANRARKHKVITPGMRVMLRDPRHKKAGGRGPYKEPFSDPCQVLEVHGNKCTVKRSDGTLVRNVHFEDALVVPTSVHDHESNPLHFEEAEAEIYVDAVRRSPGAMLADGGRTKAETEALMQKMNPGKLEKITSGNYIAYVGEDAAARKCRIGKVLNDSKRKASVLVHKHRPTVDGKMRLKWEPMFHENGAEVLGSGSVPSQEKVDVKHIVDLVQLHDGVLAHAAARRLDHRKFSWDGDIIDVTSGGILPISAYAEEETKHGSAADHSPQYSSWPT